MKVLIASTNPVKIDSVKQGFTRTFPETIFAFDSMRVESGVKDQPDTNKEAIQGAVNRIAHLRTSVPNADYYVGLEGGVEYIEKNLFSFAWIVVEDKTGKRGEARTGTFMLPSAVAQLIASGMELGDANDQVFGLENSKQKNGALGILTDDLITRTSEYANGVILALIPFQKHGNLY